MAKGHTKVTLTRRRQSREGEGAELEWLRLSKVSPRKIFCSIGEAAFDRFFRSEAQAGNHDFKEPAAMLARPVGIGQR